MPKGQLKASKKIQSVARGRKDRKAFLKKKKAVAVIQRVARDKKDRKDEFLKKKEAVEVIQSFARGEKDRKAFLKKKKAVVVLQAKVRGKVKDKKARALANKKFKLEQAQAKELLEVKKKRRERLMVKNILKDEEKAKELATEKFERRFTEKREKVKAIKTKQKAKEEKKQKLEVDFAKNLKKKKRNRKKEEINRIKEERKIKQKLELDFAKQSLKQKLEKKAVIKQFKRNKEVYLSGDRTKMTPLEIRNREQDIRFGKLPADYFSSGVSEEFLDPQLSIEKKKKEPEKRLQLVATQKFLNEQAIDTKIRLGQVPANYRSERAKKIDDFEKLFATRKYRRNRAIEKNDKKEERKSSIGMRVPLSVSQPAVNKSKIEHLDHSRGLSIGKFRNLSTGLFRKAIPIDERKRELGQYVLNDKGGREPEPFSQNGPAPEPELSRGNTPSFGLATPLDRIGRRKPKVVSKVRPNFDIIRSSTDRPSYQPRTQSQTTRTRRSSLGGTSLRRRPSLGANPEDLE